MNDPKFLVVIPGRNTERWVEKCLNSIITQEYPFARFLWIDDDSADNSVRIARSRLILDTALTIETREERCGGLANVFSAVHMHAQDDEIVVVVGGDDWLYGNGVLSSLSKVYADPNVWVTYGQMISTDGKTGWCKPYTSEDFRSVAALHFLSPMTFRAKLFKKIWIEDLMLGYDWYPMAGDSAFGI